MPSARVFGPWPERSNPSASCLQRSCALQAEAVDTFFFFACAHLTRGRCCTSNLIAPSHSGSCALALALILICRWIGVSDSCSRVSYRCVPSSCFSVTANTQFRAPRVLKYFSLTQRAPLFGCLLTAHRHSIDQTSVSTRAKVSLATTWLW